MSELDPRPAIYRETLIKLYLSKGLSPSEKRMLERMQNLISKSEINRTIKETQADSNENLFKGSQEEIPNTGMIVKLENGNISKGMDLIEEESKEKIEQIASPKETNDESIDELTDFIDEVPKAVTIDIENEEIKVNEDKQVKRRETRKCFQCCGILDPNHECKFRLCDNCNQPGHFFRHCPWKSISKSTYDGTLCSLCQTRGHKVANCFKRSYPLSKSIEFNKARCYVCQKVGHLNCMVEDANSSSDSDSSSDS